MRNPLDLSGRRILVTGASSGIGRAAAQLLAGLNAEIILIGRSAERLEQTRASLSNGLAHRAIAFDLSACDEIPGWLKQLTAETGPLYGVVHAAGVQLTMALRSTTETTIDSLMRTNVYSALMLTRAFAQRGCHQSGGSIVLLSSVMGFVSKPAISLYSASKAALVGLTKSLALELAPAIRINCVSPAFVDTGMTEAIRDRMLPEQFEALRQSHPLGLGTGEDVAHAVAFLLADTGRWITGTNLIVDGGYSAQ
jgi:NAD(P)-dependent dehydrogenase (short-subunit alcohol dehydrogenase family)